MTVGPVYRALSIPLTVRQNGKGCLELAPDYAASRAIAAQIEARERMMAARRRRWWTRLAEWLRRQARRLSWSGADLAARRGERTMAEEVASVVAESSAENPDAPPRPQMRHVRMTRDGVEVLFLHASSLGVAKSDVEGLVGIFISCPSEIDVGMFVALIPEKAREVAKSLTDAAAEIEMGHTVH